MNFKIYTYYSTAVPINIAFYQRQVFKMLGYKIIQKYDNTNHHGNFLNETMKTTDAEYIIFFDIDCIPLNNKALELVLKDIKDKKTLSGAAHTANHINEGKNMYVGPFFMGLSKELYTNLGAPNLSHGEDFDTAMLLTSSAEKQESVKIKYWYPTSCEFEKWQLYQHGKYGIGTIYENLVYHGFEIRLKKSNILFINKCKQVIKENRSINMFRYYKIQLELYVFRVFYRLKLRMQR